MSGALPVTQPSDPIRDQAYTALAVASVAYQQEVITLTHYLECAQKHGLTVADMCEATGMDRAFVEHLLIEAT